MKRIITVLSLMIFLSGCEWWQAQYEMNDGIPEIRSQADVEAYNATVSSESEKLICERERVIGSNIRQWVCLTVAQRDRLAEESQREVQDITNQVLAN